MTNLIFPSRGLAAAAALSLLSVGGLIAAMKQPDAQSAAANEFEARVSVSLVSNETASDDSEEVPEPLKRAIDAAVTDGGGGVHKLRSVYKVDDSLYGVLTNDSASGLSSLFFITGSGLVIQGDVLRPNGRRIGDGIFQTGRVRPFVDLRQQEIELSNERFDKVLRAPAIEVGHAGPVVSVFYDPLCGACRHLYKDLQPPVDAGQLRVRYIPVSVIGRDRSMPIAAHLYAHPSAATLTLVHAEPMSPKVRADLAKAEGALAMKRVQAADELLTSLGDQLATPLLVYRTARGARYTLGQVLPPPALVARLAGGD